ncbi:MAG TPA: IclR family transcriptional regulator [Armatimonadota bacterium]|jgi:DNA-binding IclR family transcriptional regulator
MADTTYAAPAASRLLDILELLTGAESGLSLAEISRRLDISLNSAFRICRVLEERGYLVREEGSGLLRLTIKLYTLGIRLGDRWDLLQQARPVLQWLTEATGENAHLCVLRDEWLVLLSQTVSPHPIRVVVETGVLLYPHASAFGKVILANLPLPERESLLVQYWPRLTPYTQTDPVKIAAEWEEVRARGVAYDLEEYQVGVRCLGAPVCNAHGLVVAGLGIMGPSYRLTPDMLASWEELVREAAGRVSAAAGAPATALERSL